MKRVAFIVAILLCAASASAQVLYHVDSSEGVWSRSVVTIASGTNPPINLIVLSGDGAKFARIGTPLLIQLSTYKDSNLYQNFELDSVSAIHGDTLVISKRFTLQNSKQYQWLNGTLVKAVNADGIIIKQLQRLVGSTNGLPDTTSNAGKWLQDVAGGVGPAWRTLSTGSGVTSFNSRAGIVLPLSGDYSFGQIAGTAAVSQGGVGLNAIASGKILYASGLNVYGPLSIGTGLQISSSTLSVYLSPFSTSDLSEGSRLYYRDSLARLAISATAPVLYNNTAGAISMSQATSLNDGYLNHSDWTTFNSKQASLTLPLSIANGGTSAGTANGALKALLPDTTGHAGHVFSDLAGGGYGWVAGGGGGTGTVTSVGLSTNASYLTIGSTPVTTSGTITANKTTGLTANQFVATPDGSTGAADLRAIVAADIPGLAASKITSGVLPVTNGGTGQSTLTNHSVLVGATTSGITQLAVGSTNTLLHGITGADASWSNIVGADIANSTIDLTIKVNGTLPVANGGIGQTTLTNHGVLIGAGSSGITQSAVGATNTLLHGNTGADPTYSAVSLTADVSGVLPVANGGTGSSTLSVWTITGNSGTTYGTNFIGTTDAAELAFKVNSQVSGRIEHLSPFNTAFGYQALNAVTGQRNAAFGYHALNAETNGTYNTAMGAEALLVSNGGSSNVACGWQALAGNTTGSYNTALGYAALATNTTGTYNTALGIFADVGSSGLTNAMAIGYNATVAASNTIQLGNGSVTAIVTNGAWNGAKIDVAHGGTGLSTVATQSLLYASASNTISGLVTANSSVLVTDGAGNVGWSTSLPTVSAIGMTPGFLTMNGPVNLLIGTTLVGTSTITGNDCVLPADATGGAFTVTLPASPASGRLIVVAKIDGTINAVTVAPNSGQSIVTGTATGLSGGNLILNLTKACGTFVYLGSNKWLLVSYE